jgi:hypothetical protein
VKGAIFKGLLWKKTTESQVWIAEHLGIKNADNASRPIPLMVLSLSEKKVSE